MCLSTLKTEQVETRCRNRKIFGRQKIFDGVNGRQTFYFWTNRKVEIVVQGINIAAFDRNFILVLRAFR